MVSVGRAQEKLSDRPVLCHLVPAQACACCREMNICCRQELRVQVDQQNPAHHIALVLDMRLWTLALPDELCKIVMQKFSVAEIALRFCH